LLKTGELMVRGPCTRFRGYFDAPERDAEAVTVDGFYRSGDLMSFRVVDGERYLGSTARVKMSSIGRRKIIASESRSRLVIIPAVLGSRAWQCRPAYGERIVRLYRAPREGCRGA